MQSSDGALLIPPLQAPLTTLVESARPDGEAQFRELMGHLRQVFWTHDASDSAVLYVSPAYETIWGRTCQSLYDNFQTLLDSVHPEDRERVAAAMASKHTTQGYDQEFRIRRPDGEMRWIWTRCYPVSAKPGETICFAAIAEDITTRKAAEKERSRLAAITEYSGDVVVSITVDGNIIAWNLGAERHYGYTAEEVLGRPLSLLFPSDHYQEYQAIMKSVRSGEPVPSHDTVRRRKDGTLIEMSVAIMPIEARDGEVVGASKISHDITRIKKLEAQCIEAQKMEAVGQLAAGVAHDFNNIVFVILGHSDLLMEELGPDHPAQKDARAIHQAAERAAGVTRQLLVFSRKQTVQPVALDLNEVVEGLEKMLRQLIDENIELTVVRGSHLGRVKADAGYVGQVLMNLVINARDAMPGGGTLSITTSDATVDEGDASTHPGAPPGEYVRLSVSDSGTGMTGAVQAHLFEPLFTTKPKGRGTGLGLATCQTIVKQSGGRIDVSSEVGKGTTFDVYFPRLDQAPDAEVTVSSPRTRSLPRGTEALLIVEDDPAVRHLASAVLKAQGYEVLVAANGQDGLRMAHDHKGAAIRLVIADVIMPLMGGKMMAEWLTSGDPSLKVLFTSGYTDDAIAQYGVLDPGVAFLPKPFTAATLIGKVRELLDGPARPLNRV
jgi:two-component system cell cycle sensor histidine kinase/response regulator CckA